MERDLGYDNHTHEQEQVFWRFGILAFLGGDVLCKQWTET